MSQSQSLWAVSAVLAGMTVKLMEYMLQESAHLRIVARPVPLLRGCCVALGSRETAVAEIQYPSAQAPRSRLAQSLVLRL